MSGTIIEFWRHRGRGRGRIGAGKPPPYAGSRQSRLEQQIARVSALFEELEGLNLGSQDVPLALIAQAQAGIRKAREILRAAPGVRVVDDPASSEYPLPSDAVGDDDVLVGRIRRDPSRQNGLALWIVSDNLRKGAAPNGVLSAELLVERDLVRVPGRAAA